MLKGVIFDLDGVVTGTAKIHSLAWESMFNTFLKEYAEANNEPFVPFDPALDYLKYVDGKPRMEGVRSFLESRDIELPFGEIDDIPEMPTICGLGNRKNEVFTEILIKEGPEVFQSTVDFIRELKSRGIRIGIASSSRNSVFSCDLSVNLIKDPVKGFIFCEKVTLALVLLVFSCLTHSTFPLPALPLFLFLW